MTVPLFAADVEPPAFSPCGRYRYTLHRQWGNGGHVLWVMCNPSTATATVDDPTVRRELGFARDWGFGRYVKVNAYGLRSTDPKGLWSVTDPRGPDNFLAIKVHSLEAMTKRRRYYEWLVTTENARRAARKAGSTVTVPTFDEWALINA